MQPLEALRHLAEKALQDGRFSIALKAYAGMGKKISVHTALEYGRKAKEKGRPWEACPAFKEAGATEELIELIQDMCDHSHYDDAVKLAHELGVDAPTDALIAKGKKQLKGRSYADAARAYKAAGLEPPVQEFLKMAEMELATGNYQLAEAAYEAVGHSLAAMSFWYVLRGSLNCLLKIYGTIESVPTEILAHCGERASHEETAISIYTELARRLASLEE